MLTVQDLVSVLTVGIIKDSESSTAPTNASSPESSVVTAFTDFSDAPIRDFADILITNY